MGFVIAGDTHGTLDLAKVVQYYDVKYNCSIGLFDQDDGIYYAA